MLVNVSVRNRRIIFYRNNFGDVLFLIDLLDSHLEFTSLYSAVTGTTARYLMICIHIK